MTKPIEPTFEQTRKAFLGFLKYAKGHADTTCYNYHSDLGIWQRWLDEANLDWRNCTPTDMEQFVSRLSREGIGPHAIARKVSCLATFYKWAKSNHHVQEDPIYQIEKPKRPRRMLVWLETEEQAALMKATRNYDDTPDNVFGRSREFSMAVRVVGSVAKHVRVIDKAGIEKKVTPHKLRHTYATRLLEKDVQMVDIQALLGHESIATTQIYTHAGQERLSKLVADI